MAWIPLHEAYPDGTYYVTASSGSEQMVPIDEHPDFSLVDGAVVWERQDDTEQVSPASGTMPRIIFARPDYIAIDLQTRVTLEELHVYTDTSDFPNAVLGGFDPDDPWGLSGEDSSKELGRTDSPYVWDYGSHTSETTLVEGGAPTSHEFDPVDPNESSFNAVQYEFTYGMV